MVTQEPVPAEKGIQWHALTPEAALKETGSAMEGLSSAEAEERLRRDGPNVLAGKKADSVFVLIMRQIRNPLIYVLLGSGVLAIIMGKVTDGIVVLGVVVLNTIIGFLQEYKASRAIEALSSIIPITASVIRDGQRTTVETSQLVRGDVVEVASGDKIAADMRIISSRGLQIIESALTGESLPVDKKVEEVVPDAMLGDRTNMLYSGSLVSSGSGRGVVIATAGATEIGRISSMLDETSELETPLTRSLAQFGRVLTIAILVVAVIIFFVGLYRGYDITMATLAAITLAVAAIPEGLPAIITIALAIGVQRMAQRNAVVRRLPCVETLGSTTVICSDKTGTLTRNEMTVQEAWVPAGGFEITGVGYGPEGEIKPVDGTGGDEGEQQLDELLLAGLLCSDAVVAEEEDGWTVHGDPTEGAFVVAAGKRGLDVQELRNSHKRLDAIPFESETKFMATLQENGEGGCVAYLKGAVEVILPRCVNQGGALTDERLEELAAKGLRLLAFARKEMPAGTTDLTTEHVQEGLTLLGVQGMIDAAREEAMAAVEVCHRAGIAVKMITGDHPATAAVIGEKLGILKDKMKPLPGKEIADANDEQLLDAAEKTHVFARVAPEHKLRLVRALQSRGHVVAMTGDGVNDAPALKQSDIGVAMGITGTEVAKESADIVLADDNFASIAAAVEEGRRVYDNLLKSLAFVLPTNLGEALILLVAVMTFPVVGGMPLLPMLPTQILWINLVATVALALPLAFEAKEPDIMERPPRNPREPLLNRFILYRTLVVAVLMTAGALALFLWEFRAYWEVLREGDPLNARERLAYQRAQTISVTAVVFFQIFYLLNCRSLKRSIFAIGVFSNKLIYLGIGVLLLLQLAFVYLAPLNRLFGSAPLRPLDIAKCIATGALVLPVIGLEKWVRNRRPKPASS